MKRITAIALFAIASFAMAGRSYAQEHPVQATVPFDFTVSNKLLPAGTYTIHKESSNLIVIKNHDKPIAVFALATPDGRESKYGKLVFNRYGDQYFLSEILCQSSGMNVEVVPSKLEKRVLAQEAWVDANSPVFVAAR